MLSSVFTRDNARVSKAFSKVGTSLIALEPLRIMIPEGWVKQGLAIIEDVVSILGMVAIITDDNAYASTSITAMVRTEPDRITTVIVDDVPYLTLFYNKGSTIWSSTEIVVVDIMVHPIYTVLYGRAKVPWYYDYERLLKIFHNTGKYNGTDGKADPAIWSYIGASICRDPDNLRQYYRQRGSAKADVIKHPPITIPLKNVSINADSLVAKLSGSYFDPGTTSALAHPSKRPDTVESILRYK